MVAASWWIARHVDSYRGIVGPWWSEPPYGVYHWLTPWGAWRLKQRMHARDPNPWLVTELWRWTGDGWVEGVASPLSDAGDLGSSFVRNVDQYSVDAQVLVGLVAIGALVLGFARRRL